MTDYKKIKKDYQIHKFCLYGFLKNLRFFEPYLLIYFLGMGLNLFQIGVLFSIREVITYIFEVPSGVLADQYGKKKELLLCFTFYIISFIFLFVASNILVLAFGMVFFGLGEAFRSGTHKAMILCYLEKMDWYKHKGFVYGRTRSYSLLGSSVSAFLSILLVLKFHALRWVFIISIIPYILNFILIATYPEYLNEKKDTKLSIKEFFKAGASLVKSINKNANIMRIIFSSASYDGVFKTIKDYIQPILATLILAVGAGAIKGFDGQQSLKIYLGVIYGIFYICSSFASKNVYRLTVKFSSKFVFEKLFDLMGIVLILLAVIVHEQWLFLAIILFFLLYLMKDARRPVFVDLSGDYMDKEQRVTTLSIESQIKALFIMVMAPLFGWIADTFSISILFGGIGIILLLLNRILIFRNIN